MDSLPVQLIEEILDLPILSARDLLNFSSTCHHFREVVTNSRYIWRRYYHTKWPKFAKLFRGDINEWLEEIRYIYELTKRTHNMLSEMARRFYIKNQLSDVDLAEWVHLSSESPRAYVYIVNDLLGIVSDYTPIETIELVPVDTPGNHTLQYYATKALRQIRQAQLYKEWKNCPEEEKTYEYGALFLAHWFQTNLNLEYVQEELDGLSNLVKEHMRIVYPVHPLHTVPSEILQKWKMKNLVTNHWNEIESQQIIQSLNTVFYEDLQFSQRNSRSSHINKALGSKQSCAETLAIIYESIARRLGLKFELISFPDALLKCNINLLNCYYINVGQRGKIIHEDIESVLANHPKFLQKYVVPISTIQFVVQFTKNRKLSYEHLRQPTDEQTVIYSCLKLLHRIIPLDDTLLSDISSFYKRHDMGLTEFHDWNIAVFHDQCHAKTIRKRTPKLRFVNLRYAVGMIMKHVGSNRVCVICHWNESSGSPVYTVLFENSKQKQVTEDFLIPTADSNVLYLCENIGRHFSHFFENHFVPNTEKESEYPEDAAIRHRYYHKLKFSED